MPFPRDIQRIFAILAADGPRALTRSARRAAARRLIAGDPWAGYAAEASAFVSLFNFSPEDAAASRALLEANPGPLDIRSLTWFVPDFTNAFYGGIHTILRFAAGFQAKHGVASQFAHVGTLPEAQISAAIARAFPALAGSPVVRVTDSAHLAALAPTDACVSTLWNTAYFALRLNNVRRKFYFIQDYEPLFYPAGSTSALVEASYRFGFYGLCNTPTLAQIYRESYGGQAVHFLPAVDTAIFNPGERPPHAPHHPNQPYKVFFYGRPGHPRNAFELGAAALRQLKHRMGEQVEIVSAGAAWHESDYGLKGVVENLGVLPYEATAELYRTCDAGLVMMFTRHPSYLPFELMASGALVITNVNPATTWFLKDNANCLLSEASASSLAARLEEGLRDDERRKRITAAALDEIRASFADWDGQIERVYRYMSDPSQPLP